MATFYIQTVDGQVSDDFTFGVMAAVKYQNWYRAGSHDMVFSHQAEAERYLDAVPVGSIQFMRDFVAKTGKEGSFTPINVPEALFDSRFLKRRMEKVILVNGEKKTFSVEKFIKNATVLKGYSGVAKETPEGAEGLYLISDKVDIETEWRLFVYRGNIVGMGNYAGDFAMLPDMDFARDCVAMYKDQPIAYTLDIGHNGVLGSFLIEIHDFYSIGLYGFSDYRILPQMFIAGYRSILGL